MLLRQSDWILDPCHTLHPSFLNQAESVIVFLPSAECRKRTDSSGMCPIDARQVDRIRMWGSGPPGLCLGSRQSC